MSPMRSGSSPSMPRRESTLWRSWGEATTSSPGRRRIQSSSTDVCSNPVDSGQMGCICWKVNASSSLCGWPFGHHKGHRGRTEKNGMSSRRHVEHHGLPHCHKQSSPCKFSGVDRSQVADTRENRGGWGSRVQSCRARYAAGWLLEAKRHQQEEPQNTDAGRPWLWPMASVIFVWRPFVSELYMALHSEQSHAPNCCIWTKQIAHSVPWLRTFLSGDKAGIVRSYSLEVFNHVGPEVMIT